MQTTIEIAMARATLRSGETISPPLLVMVVKPLKAITASATAARKPAAEPCGAEDASGAPAAHRAAAPNTAMPPILIAAITSEARPTDLDPELFTRKAKPIRPTPRTGASQWSDPSSNGLSA